MVHPVDIYFGVTVLTLLAGIMYTFFISWAYHIELGLEYSRTISSKLVAANSSTHSLLCIEDNICKKRSNDTMYIYKRRSDFLQRIESTIDTDVNVIHRYIVVPNIVHFVQYAYNSTNHFEFHHMVSVISAYKNIKPDRIYFWLDKEPVSEFWKELQRRVPMFLIYRERPTSIRGRNVTFITKVSNVIRLEAILEYGGMYFDLDVIVVKPMDKFRYYDVTMGYEMETKFCNAIIIARPWADFLRLWHIEHKTLDEHQWAYHSGKVPFLLSRKYPNMLHREVKSFFRPAWYELYQLFDDGELYDWRTHNYCIHLWIRIYVGRRRVRDEIDNWNTTVGEVFRYILYSNWSVRG